mmetsp:Transcript_36504/g.66030  ORF Transcript_36504/g.66030 Transcript_36504/m.66030 type:complete len:180 (+) Transcript_36504:239-778(+)
MVSRSDGSPQSRRCARSMAFGLLLVASVFLLRLQWTAFAGSARVSSVRCVKSSSTLSARSPLAARSAVEKCEGEAFIDEAIKSTAGDQSVLLLSFSTTWCGPCKLMDPKITELSQTFAGKVRVIKIMGDADPDGKQIMKREAIRSVPQYQVYKNGEKVDVITGAQYDALLTSLKTHTNS